MKKIDNVKIAYIGGGSRGWARYLMSDLALSQCLSGKVSLYDIDFAAAKDNENIGNGIMTKHPEAAKWEYKSETCIKDALTGADVVVVSILPGTFDEMQSDVHTPEKYGIYQSVGDTVGPGGIIRALRTIPMFIEIAEAVRDYCPNAWVINYTNPMTICIKTLYKAFPEIKAFGCCHEVFGTQKFLAKALAEVKGIKDVPRQEIITDVYGINHFTWIPKARYKDIDLFPVYEEFIKMVDDGKVKWGFEGEEHDLVFKTDELVKMDLFKRYGIIAAAGDRHLAEFVPIEWYMKNPEQVAKWGFALTSVDWRKKDLEIRLERNRKLLAGEEEIVMQPSGEEGVLQIEAVLGCRELITNVNLPNVGQIPNLPLGAVVETNAAFRNDSVLPISAGELPMPIYQLVAPIVAEQETVVEAAFTKDLELAYKAFSSSNHMPISLRDSRALFNEMIDNTKEYLKDYYNI